MPRQPKRIKEVSTEEAGRLLGISGETMRYYCAQGRVLDPVTREPITRSKSPWRIPLEPQTGKPIITASEHPAGRPATWKENDNA